MPKSKKSLLSFVSTRWLIVSVTVIVVLLSGTAYMLLRNSSKGKTVETIPSTSSNTGSSQKSEPVASNPVKDNSQSQTATQKDIQASSGTNLTKPSGQFVSNHHPSLSGSKEMYSESSVCNTTPGASCYITFTMGSLIKKLGAQLADTNGAVYWDWDIKTAGLSQGTWTINAVASLNGQTLSAQDSQNLEVQP